MAVSLTAAGVTVVPLALALSHTRSKNPQLAGATELQPVGATGLEGPAFVQKDGDEIRFSATLTCSRTCPSANTAQPVRVRFTLADGLCGQPPGETISLGGGALRARGAVVRNVIVSPNNDLNLGYRGSVRATWDLGGDGRFEPAACGFVLMQYFGFAAPKRFTLTAGSASCTREVSSGNMSCTGTSAAAPKFSVRGDRKITLSGRVDSALPRGWYITIVDLPAAIKCDSRKSGHGRGCSVRVGPWYKRLHTVRGRLSGVRNGENFFLSIEFQQTG